MTASTVPSRAKQDAEAPGIPGVEPSIWTERMVLALVNGVEGGKWYSLMDKVHAPATLALAWSLVQGNHGAAGVDGQSVERFAARADDYLAELGRVLKQGCYRPEAVKRVEIPKGDGKTRPLGIPTVKDRIVQTAAKWQSSNRSSKCNFYPPVTGFALQGAARTPCGKSIRT